MEDRQPLCMAGLSLGRDSRKEGIMNINLS